MLHIYATAQNNYLLFSSGFTHIYFCRNIASQTIARLKDVARRISNYLEAEHVSKERSASLDLLLRFQRLLVSKLYLGVNDIENVNGYSKFCISTQMFPVVQTRVIYSLTTSCSSFRSRASGCWFPVKEVHRPAVYSHWRHPPSSDEYRFYRSPPLC